MARKILSFSFLHCIRYGRRRRPPCHVLEFPMRAKLAVKYLLFMEMALVEFLDATATECKDQYSNSNEWRSSSSWEYGYIRWLFMVYGFPCIFYSGRCPVGHNLTHSLNTRSRSCELRMCTTRHVDAMSDTDPVVRRMMATVLVIDRYTTRTCTCTCTVLKWMRG